MAGYFWLSLENLLARDNFTLEEVLDEDNVIQGCKSANRRLLSYFEGREQVKQMVHYVITPPPENSDRDKYFKYAFVSCAVLTGEIDGILNTLVEDEELLNFLFTFIEPDYERDTLLAGYFSKVVICLLLRKTEEVMQHLQTRKDILRKMVDLIGSTSIMEVLMRLVGADDQIYTFHSDAVQWLAETELLQMLVDKLRCANLSEEHANAASTLCAVMRLSQSALAVELSSPRFVSKLVNQALEDAHSKSTVVHSLSVCISVLEPKRAVAGRVQNTVEQAHSASPDTIDVMVEKLGDVLKVLDTSNDETVMPTTYGELRPPFGTHRLKIVEFIAILLRADTDKVGKALVELQGLQLLLNLFFDYPFNNMMHHHVESIILTCVESSSSVLIDNLFKDCDFLGRLLAVDENPYAPDTRPESKKKAKQPPRVGNIGHLTRIANRLLQVEDRIVQSYLREHSSWVDWKMTVLQERNSIENVYQWACGRPVPIQNRPVDSDEDDFRDRDYDVSTMASNLTREVFRYGMFEHDGTEEDVFYDDESAEVVINTLQLTDEQESARLFGNNSPWFAFTKDDLSKALDLGSSPPKSEDELIVSYSLGSSGSSSSDDEVVVGEDDELADTATSSSEFSALEEAIHLQYCGLENGETPGFHKHDEEENLVDISSDLEALDLAGSSERKESDEQSGSCQFDGGTVDEVDRGMLDQVLVFEMELGSETRNGDREIIKDAKQLTGVEPEATAKAMEKALREGIVGEAAPLHLPVATATAAAAAGSKAVETDSVTTEVEFNDVNYWRSDYDHSIADLEKT